MATSVRSYSKINLGLAIGPPRPDGFHSLTTLYQTIALHDVVTVTVKSVQPGPPAQLHAATLSDPPHPASDSTSTQQNSTSSPISATSGAPFVHAININCTSNNIKVPLNNTNTAVKMLEKALFKLNLSANIDVHIQKNLPVQGGLGAGSANAAAALIALETELNKTLAPAERLALAAEIGSDVPLFLLGGTVLGLSRGESVFPFPDLPQLPCIVVVPPTGVSTPQAFADWDKLPENELTAAPNSDRLNELSRVLASAFAPSGASGVLPIEQGLAGNPLLALVRTGIENDFERVVFPLHQSLRAIKRLLSGSSTGGALYAALSGSGSALFGLYRDVADAKAAQERVLEFVFKELPGTEVLLTSTLTREAYWREMVLKG